MKNVFFFFVLFLFIIGCEKHTNPDTTPPTVTIIDPQTGSIVNEIVSIICISTDNIGVEKLELWVNGESTGVIDNTEPYSLDWLTYTYEDSSYIITVRSYDTSNNKTDSDPITLITDNSGSFPTPVELYPVIYQNGSFIITWSQNNDADFSSYTLYESLFEDMSNNNLLYDTNSNADTSYIDITTEEIKYYQVVVEDSVGIQSSSNIQEGNSIAGFVTTFGGNENDYGKSVQQTTDDGYIIAGKTESFGNGNYDIWLIKADSQGNEEWNQTYGGDNWDYAKYIQQTSDGGYFVAGNTQSYGNGMSDFWLIKTDANGIEEWNNTHGAGDWDHLSSAQQTTDGGYIITGDTESYGAGGSDFWLIKTDASGNEEWNKTYGGIDSDYASSIQQTYDGGYIITGYTDSYGAGSYDCWLIKTDENGNEEWDRTLGGNFGDYAHSVQQTTDSGYILTGNTESYGAGNRDLWIIKTDANGNEEWNRTFGGNETDSGSSVQQTIDGGYIITGFTQSFGNGGSDVWLIKTDSDGNTVP